MSNTSSQSWSSFHVNGFLPLGLVLLLALVNGLSFVFVVPPWQHYDETNHFEYVWLLADRGELPQPGDFDTTMRQSVAASMVQYGFFEGWDSIPELGGKKPWIGTYSQLDEPPLYYWLASFPLRIFSPGDVTAQLHTARLVSLLLFLVSILAGWGLTKELTPQGHALRLIVPLTMALLPAYVDLMTSVNNNVVAVTIFSLFLWGGVRLTRHGFSLLNILWSTGTAVLCLWAKSMVFIALPLLSMAFLFALFRGRWRRLAWGLLISGALIGIITTISWGDAAYWHRGTSQAVTTRVHSPIAPLGEYVFRLETLPNFTPPWFVPIYQPFPLSIGRSLKGKSVTLGAWIWASESLQISTPILNCGNNSFSKELEITDVPSFYAFKVDVPLDTNRVWVTLKPLPKVGKTDATIYYDGFIMAEGDYPLKEAPQFENIDGLRGVWGEQPFENLLRNPSAEQPWPAIRSWADSLGARILPDQTRPSTIISSVLDLSGTGWFYNITGQRLLRTFWALFGWGDVPLLGHKPYRLLAFVTLLGLSGAVLVFWRAFRHLRSTISWDVFVFLSLATLGLWGATLIRGIIYMALPHLYIPVARYAYPVIIPTVLLLNLGWIEILNRLRIPTTIQLTIHILLFLALDIFSLVSIAQFYHL